MKKTILSLVAVALGIITILFLTNSFSAIKYAGAEANYKEYCASCHGAQLKSFIDRKWVHGNSWNEVFKAIKVGYPDEGMPAYDTTFTDTEIDALVEYILNGFEQLAKEDFSKERDWSGVIESEEQKFKVETVVDGLDIPWGMAFLPNGDMLITERNGALYRHSAGENLHPIAKVPEVKAKGQGGLLDVIIHPNFTENQLIYLSFSKPKDDDATTAILRAKLVNDELVDKRIIFEADPYLGTRHHYGSRLAFDKEGYLYCSVGDRGRRNQNPQSLGNHCGKIHRLHDDGRIPEDNPFVNTPNAKKSIYSYGHRNPQGLVIDTATNTIWETEHGPRGGDEVNTIRPGLNYGWPVISYGINYSGTKFTDLTEKEGMEQPESYWVPSIGACGLAFVNSDKYPNWKGDLLAGSLSFNYIARMKIENGKVVGEEPLLKNIGRMRDIKMGNDGLIYFSVEDPGAVMRIVPL